MEIPEGQVDSASEQDFKWKVQYMIKDLTSRGCLKSTVAPPFYRLAWSMGWQLVPPLFAQPWKLFLFTSAVVGTGWALGMWLLFKFIMELPGFEGKDEWLELGKYFGYFFGFAMGLYYRYVSNRLGLPRWEEYPHG